MNNVSIDNISNKMQLQWYYHFTYLRQDKGDIKCTLLKNY